MHWLLLLLLLLLLRGRTQARGIRTVAPAQRSTAVRGGACALWHTAGGTGIAALMLQRGGYGRGVLRA
eukprot:1057834-Pelagomonas_calceolata.AAC.1